MPKKSYSKTSRSFPRPKPELKPRVKRVHVKRFYMMSHNADRSIRGIGLFKGGVWVEVPEKLYNQTKNEIASGKVIGKDIGWKVDLKITFVEVNP